MPVPITKIKKSKDEQKDRPVRYIRPKGKTRKETIAMVEEAKETIPPIQQPIREEPTPEPTYKGTPLIAGVPYGTPPRTQTVSQYQQSLIDQRLRYGETAAELELIAGGRGDIDPHTPGDQPVDPLATYFLKRPHPDKSGEFLKGDLVVSGTELMSMYSEQAKQYRQAQAEIRTAFLESHQWHPDTKVTKTKKGYEIQPPTEEQAFKKYYEAVHPGEQQMGYFFAPVSRFILGTGSLVSQLTKGAIKVRVPSEKASGGHSFFIHDAPRYPTITDVPLSMIPNPFGEDMLAPEWKSRWIKEHPESLIVGGAGEGALFAGFGLGISAVGSGVKTVGSGAIKISSKTYSHIQKFMPSSKLSMVVKPISHFKKWGYSAQHTFGGTTPRFSYYSMLSKTPGISHLRTALVQSRGGMPKGYALREFIVGRGLTSAIYSPKSGLRDLSVGQKGGFHWAEDIPFMPSKSDTFTRVYMTSKGPVVHSVGKGGKVISVARITNIPGGKQGEMLFNISGKTTYKHFAPGELIPSMGKKVFHGTSSVKELPMTGKKISSDWILTKSKSSYKVTDITGGQPSRALTVYDPHKIWRFDSRLLRETHFQESITMSKQMGGTKQVSSQFATGKLGKGIYKTKTVEMPKFDFSYSLSKIPSGILPKDFAVTLYPPSLKVSISGALGSGGSVSGPSGSSLYLPGGGGFGGGGDTIFSQLSTASSIFPSMVSKAPSISLANLEAMESGIYQGVHSRWVAPSLKHITTQSSLSGSSYLNASAMDVGVMSISSLAHVQGLKSKSELESKLAHDLSFSQGLASYSISDIAQAQQQKQAQVQKQVQQLAVVPLSLSFGAGFQISQPFEPDIFKSRLPVVPIPFLWPDEKGRRRKQKKSFDPFDEKYLYREFDIPKLGKVFNI